MFESTITLFCRFGPKKADAFAPAVLDGVHCSSGFGQAAGVPHGKSQDRAMLLIPFAVAEGYVAPAVWRALSPQERAGKWSLQPGDVFVLGELDAGCALSPSAYLQANGGFVITSVTERKAGKAMSHFAVGAGNIYQHGGGVL